MYAGYGAGFDDDGLQSSKGVKVTLSFVQTARLIAVDCDGTFFDSDGYPSRQTHDVAEQIAARGHQLVAVTGRSRRTACKRLEKVAGLRHLVCSNGAYAWNANDHSTTWCTHISPDQATLIQSILRNHFPDAAFGWEAPEGIGYDECFIELAGGLSELETGGESGEPWSQSLYKIKIRRPQVSHLDLRNEVEAVLGNCLGEITTSGAPFVEITATGAHKGAGLEKTAKMLGFSAADTIVFGDNHNDLPMFKWAGHAVAMGNALDEVKAQAQSITLSNKEHGVAHYLEKMLSAGTL